MVGSTTLTTRLDVVTTATLRPELLDLTLRSFSRRLFSKFEHCRLILNIDPLPACDEQTVAEMLRIARDWFPEVVYRCPATPSFPAAVHWAWSQVESDFVFHLEDDWLLLKHVDPARVMAYFEAAPQLAEVTLNPSRNRPGVQGMALRPSFLRRSFITAALPLFDLQADPEKQWRHQLVPGAPLHGWNFRHYGEIGEGHFVKDMGAVWRKAHALNKWGAGDVTWSQEQLVAWRKQLYQWKFHLYSTIWSAWAGNK